MTWKRVSLRVVGACISLIAVAGIISFWKLGVVSEPGMVDEPLTVSVLRELAMKAEQYKSAHPSLGYPSHIGELYHPQVDAFPLQCGTITHTAEEICSLQSK